MESKRGTKYGACEVAVYALRLKQNIIHAYGSQYFSLLVALDRDLVIMIS